MAKFSDSSVNFPKVPPVGISLWEDLYRQAVEFRNAKPWMYMCEKDIFAIEDPVTGELGFCNITGAAGLHRALSIYDGISGLHFLLDLLRPSKPLDPETVLLKCSKLEVSFEDKDTLEDWDLEIIKKLELRFRGSLNWPMFRDFKPGYFPWYIDEKGAKYLDYALNMAYLVAMNVFAGGDRIPSPVDEGRFVVFRLEKSGEEMKLKGEIRDVPVKPKEESHASADEIRLQRIARNITAHSGVWEIGGVYSKVAITDNKRSRPYYPALLLWIDTTQEKVILHKLCKKEDLEKTILEGTLKAIEKENRIPVEIKVYLENTHHLLAPVGAKLKILITRTAPSALIQGFLKYLKATIEQPELFGGVV